MDRKISYLEYKRRIFNEAVLHSLGNVFLEVFGLREASMPNLVSNGAEIVAGNDPRHQVLNGNTASNLDPSGIPAMATRMAHTFYADELNLNNATIGQTRKRLGEACRFLAEAGEVAEEIADTKAKDAEEEKVEIMDSQEAELSPEDKAVLNQLFVVKGPTPQVDKIRDATVNALMAEEKKAQEVRDATDLAKAQQSEDPKAFEETVRRIEAVGPTSLMHAIMNSVSVMAVKDISEAGRFSDVPSLMRENAETIKDRSMLAYALYESLNVLGLKKFTRRELADLTQKIYYGE